MKTSKPLTEKQQLKIKNKVYKTLLTLGFTKQEEGYYSLNFKDKIILYMGRDLRSWGGEISSSWEWQTSKVGEKPYFGYSGTLSNGSQWATYDTVIETTLQRIFELGRYQGWGEAKAEWKEKKDKIKKVLADCNEAL